MQLILITGLSGSGKSVALNVLEDSGYYYVDNLPLQLLQQTVDVLAASGQERAALSIDLRSARELAGLPGQLADFRKRGHDVRVLFLEAKTDTLIKRFSETRRRHPLADDRLTLTECIERERELLAEIADLAHRVDTSDLGPNTLRGWIKDFVGLPHAGLTLLFESFGFKHGLPLDADLVFDVRCLPNPNYDPRLRPLTGRDRPVIEFLESDPATRRDARGHPALRRRLAARLRARQPQLSHRRDRLHRRPAPLGLSRRNAGRPLPQPHPGAGAPPRANVRS